MTRRAFSVARFARRFWRMHKIPVYDCRICGQQAVIYVTERGHICMHCGEKQ